MKFPYPELITQSLTGQRFYITPEGNAYPSITTMLGITMRPEKVKALNDWRTALGGAEADRQSNAAATRGTNVHRMIEEFLNGDKVDQSNVSPDDIQIFNSLRLKFKNINEIWGQEVALYSNMLEIAGRCDFIGVYKNKDCIIDFKTSNNHKDKNKIDDYYMQMTFYGLAHNEMFGTNINDGVILMGCSNGLPLEFKVDLRQYVDPLCDRIDAYYKKFAA